jgi:aerobic C4-dicarboxylate transport protein
MASGEAAPRGGADRKVVKQLWFWVIVAIILGVVFGLVAPDTAKKAKWLADAFLQLIKTVTGPVIFVTVVVGIASLGNMARAGGLALKALGYFFCATVVALALGLLVVNLVQPGSGFESGPTEAGRMAAKESIGETGDQGIVPFITDDLLPTSFVAPFVDLRVLVLAILVAAAISNLPTASASRSCAASRRPARSSSA